MDEKLSDHGLDHPFFITVISFLFLALAITTVSKEAGATSFGPIPLVGQIEHAPYVLQGTAGGRTVELDPSSQNPYTYWRFSVEEQLRGPQRVGSEILLRSPGGELGGIGYQVAGSADFGDNERVVVMAKDTNQDGVLEVYGLASGKYSILDKGNGKTEIQSGLGLILMNNQGVPLTLENLQEVVARVQEGRVTESDREIILNRNPETNHNHDAPHVAESEATENATVVAAATQNTDPNTPPGNDSTQKSVSDRRPASDKSLTGTSEDVWTKLVAIGMVLTALLLVAVFFVRKPND